MNTTFLRCNPSSKFLLHSLHSTLVSTGKESILFWNASSGLLLAFSSSISAVSGLMIFSLDTIIAAFKPLASDPAMSIPEMSWRDACKKYCVETAYFAYQDVRTASRGRRPLRFRSCVIHNLIPGSELEMHWWSPNASQWQDLASKLNYNVWHHTDLTLFQSCFQCTQESVIVWARKAEHWSHARQKGHSTSAVDLRDLLCLFLQSLEMKSNSLCPIAALLALCWSGSSLPWGHVIAAVGLAIGIEALCLLQRLPFHKIQCLRDDGGFKRQTQILVTISQPQTAMHLGHPWVHQCSR